MTSMMWMACKLMLMSRMTVPAVGEAALETETSSERYHHSRFTLAAFREQGVQGMELEDGALVLRALQRAVEFEDVTVVTTADELLDAINASALHIEIRAHLDLTSVEPQEQDEELHMLNLNDEITNMDFGNSIRGNCSTEPSAAALRLSGTAGLDDWQLGQCVIVTDVRLMTVKQHLWLHGLYIRHHRSPRSEEKRTIYCDTEDCNLWLTNITLQGDGGSQSTLGRALTSTGGQIYASGLSIFDFVGDVAALSCSNGATVTVEGCNITRNSVSDRYANSALISVNGVDPESENGVQLQDTIMRLQQCTLSGNTAPHTILQNSRSAIFTNFDAKVYSDEEREVFVTEDSEKSTTLPIDRVPTDRPGINASSVWFVEVQQSSSFWPDDEMEKSSNTEEKSSSSGAIIGGIVAVVVLFIAAICTVLLCKRRKTAHSRDKNPNVPLPGTFGVTHKAAPEKVAPRLTETTSHVHQARMSQGCYSERQRAPGSGHEPLELFSLAVPDPAFHGKEAHLKHQKNEYVQQHGDMLSMLSHSHGNTSSTTERSGNSTFRGSSPGCMVSTVVEQVVTVPETRKHNLDTESRVQPQKRLPQAPGPTVTQYQTEESSQHHSLDTANTVVQFLQPPGPEAAYDDKMAFLQQQLDSFGADTPIVDDLLSLGSSDSERRQGGQAVVQMVVRKGTMHQYAMKLFVSRAAFDEENGLYRQGSGALGGGLAQFLPTVLKVCSNDDQQLKDPHGHPLPPCIVMERGESLDLWAARRHPDRVQAFSMINQLATRLKELHALGYVHRDLKPGNVMWLPRENRWTIIDFGCVARAGDSARLGFSMTYAAPEVIAAYRQGEHTLVAQEALDIWSLGVMAFELLTGKPAFRMAEGKDQIMDRIEGFSGLQLPWEGTLSPVVRTQLGVFRASVLKLLNRDPSQRPSMEDFCLSCDRVLAGTTTVHV